MSQRLFCESVEWCVQYDVNIVRMENHTSICVCSSFRCCSQFSISADFWCDHQLLELTNYRIDSSVPSAICQNGNDKWFLYISIAPVSIRHSCKWSGNVKSTSHSQNAGCWVSSILRHNQSHSLKQTWYFCSIHPKYYSFRCCFRVQMQVTRHSWLLLALMCMFGGLRWPLVFLYFIAALNVWHTTSRVRSTTGVERHFKTYADNRQIERNKYH